MPRKGVQRVAVVAPVLHELRWQLHLCRAVQMPRNPWRTTSNSLSARAASGLPTRQRQVSFGCPARACTGEGHSTAAEGTGRVPHPTRCLGCRRPAPHPAPSACAAGSGRPHGTASPPPAGHIEGVGAPPGILYHITGICIHLHMCVGAGSSVLHSSCTNALVY